jgi:hypothetical protein
VMLSSWVGNSKLLIRNEVLWTAGVRL